MKIRLRIPSLPGTPLQIGEYTYRMHATCFHHGSEFGEGHYTAVIKSGKKYIKANDTHVSECHWPRGGQDVYLVFYRRDDRPPRKVAKKTGANKCKKDKEACVIPIRNKPQAGKTETVPSSMAVNVTDYEAALLKAPIKRKARSELKGRSTKRVAAVVDDDITICDIIINDRDNTLAQKNHAERPRAATKATDERSASYEALKKTKGTNKEINNVSAKKAKLQSDGTTSLSQMTSEANGTTGFLVWPAFSNTDGVSCYANASLQSLLSYQPLRDSLAASQEFTALKTIAERFQTKSDVTLSTFSVRVEAGNKFSEARQQDVPDFMRALINKHQTLQEMTRFKEVTELKCNSCGIEQERKASESYVLPVPVPTIDRAQDANRLFNAIGDWSEGDSKCELYHCQGGRNLERTRIDDPSDLLIIQLLLFKQDEAGKWIKNSQCQVSASLSETLTIAGSSYKLHASIIHMGNSHKSGHYVAFIQHEESVIYVNDEESAQLEELTSIIDTPYVLIYKRCDR